MYIEREALLDLLADTDRCGYLDGGDINGIPTADVAPVVRCKDFRFYETDVEYYGGGTKDVCRLLKRQMQCDDFCSYGERKDTDG